jgi:hypothetical protein
MVASCTYLLQKRVLCKRFAVFGAKNTAKMRIIPPKRGGGSPPTRGFMCSHLALN